MLSLVKNILEVAKGLLGLSDQLRAASQGERDRMAALFESISACLAAVSGEIRAGNVPHGRCGELMTYSQELPRVIERQIGVAKAEELGDMLRSAYRVEGLAMELAAVADKEPFLQVLEEASGKFRALANLARLP